jgi:competence protein ComEA
MRKLIDKKVLMILGSSLILVSGIIGIILFSINSEDVSASEIEVSVSSNTTTNSTNTVFVDVKGAVKNPGVYEVSSNAIVDDCIKLAGGITSSGTTKNINLSKKVYDEMVIYVFKKSELTTTAVNEIACTTEVIQNDVCLNTTTSSTTNESISTLVNINTATKEELMTLSGVGESKALAIIEYRKTNTFKTIEDIKNVSGIGDAMYEKIKDSITV